MKNYMEGSPFKQVTEEERPQYHRKRKSFEKAPLAKLSDTEDQYGLKTQNILEVQGRTQKNASMSLLQHRGSLFQRGKHRRQQSIERATSSHSRQDSALNAWGSFNGTNVQRTMANSKLKFFNSRQNSQNVNQYSQRKKSFAVNEDTYRNKVDQAAGQDDDTQHVVLMNELISKKEQVIEDSTVPQTTEPQEPNASRAALENPDTLYIQRRIRLGAQKFPNIKQLIDKMDFSTPIKSLSSLQRRNSQIDDNQEEDVLKDIGRVQIARILLQQKIKKRQQLEVMSRNMAFNHFARTTVINQISSRKQKQSKTQRNDVKQISDTSIINLNTTTACQTQSQRDHSQIVAADETLLSYRQQSKKGEHNYLLGSPQRSPRKSFGQSDMLNALSIKMIEQKVPQLEVPEATQPSVIIPSVNKRKEILIPLSVSVPQIYGIAKGGVVPRSRRPPFMIPWEVLLHQTEGYPEGLHSRVPSEVIIEIQGSGKPNSLDLATEAAL